MIISPGTNLYNWYYYYIPFIVGILLRWGTIIALVYVCYRLVQRWKKNDAEKENKKK